MRLYTLLKEIITRQKDSTKVKSKIIKITGVPYSSANPGYIRLSRSGGVVTVEGSGDFSNVPAGSWQTVYTFTSEDSIYLPYSMTQARVANNNRLIVFYIHDASIRLYNYSSALTSVENGRWNVTYMAKDAF